MNRIELHAPAGNFSKLKTAIYFGADAVYAGGKNFSLRALSDNFTEEELAEGVVYAHERGVKFYVTVNIFPRNADMEEASRYFRLLQNIGVDAVLITDPGFISLCREVAPLLPIHLSTQANTLNYRSVAFWRDEGVKRVVLARELSIAEIAEISEKVPDVQLEAFVHGAMCISYSGRCLLSNYFNGRDSNRGECVQACRWNYELRERSKNGDFYPVEEDGRGTYILNSKDLNMIEYLPEMEKAGVVSFKIEGRMKSEYYLATVVNAYRRAIDSYHNNLENYRNNHEFFDELRKTNHRAFTTAYMLSDRDDTVNYEDSQSAGEKTFAAVVVRETDENGIAVIEMRNRFRVGETLEILSPKENFNKSFIVKDMFDENGERVEDAKLVQQKLAIACPYRLYEGDVLRR